MTVYIGIDWSQAQHDVCFLDEAGEPIARMFLVVIWHVLSPRRRPHPAFLRLRFPLPSVGDFAGQALRGHECVARR